MLIHFTKMHGLGNDFVVIDLITQSLKLRTTQIKHILDRRLGIGGDQLLLLEPPIRPNADFYYRIFNANGQEVEQCGNGARCVARFFFDRGYTNHVDLQIDCLAGSFQGFIKENNLVTINMGQPIFSPEAIPFITEKETLLYSMTIENMDFAMSVVSMGNPHAILQVPHLETAFIRKLGPLLSKHASFPNETNVGFMQILNSHQIRLRVYERGVGETLACGTNACAAVVTGIRLGLLNSPVSVLFPKGTLEIAWAGDHQPVYMTGPANEVFVGYFYV